MPFFDPFSAEIECERLSLWAKKCEILGQAKQRKIDEMTAESAFFDKKMRVF
jgi:hypothetical protein